jgi:peptidoglycan/LPS O-acetylase OafA/YrhL
MKILPDNFTYRPEIDGLRAIAILVVVLYHAGLGFPGGFIGVDVFFVISGYLITSLILKDLQNERFSLRNFWERRIKRIVPAATVLVVSVLVAGWFLLLPDDYADLGRSALSQAVFGANIYFYKTLDYFDAAADEKPLLHTWSLAVEEQFYLLFPFVVVLLLRSAFFRTRKGLILLFASGALASFALSVWSVKVAPLASFYLLPSRSWELLLGSVIALVPRPPDLRAKNWIFGVLAWSGVAAIVLASTVYTSDTPFPGIAALLPVIGAALFIWASNRHECMGSGFSARALLATRPAVFIGLISYSLYLWHWPLLAFATYIGVVGLPLSTRLGLVFLSFVLAVLSWRFVETPLRHGASISRSRIYAGGVASVAVIALLSASIMATGGFPGRVDAEILRIADVRLQRPEMDEIGLDRVKRDEVITLAAGDEVSARLLLWGDSHAWSVAPAVADLCRKHGLKGTAIYYPATPPLVDFVNRSNQGLDFRSPQWAEAVIDYVRRNGIKYVLAAGYWGKQAQDSPPGVLERAIADTVADLNAAGAHVFFLLQVPSHQASAPDAIARSLWFGEKQLNWLSTRAHHQSIHQRVKDAATNVTEGRLTVIDPEEAFFDAQTGQHLAEVEGEVLFYDSHHLSNFGARKILFPFLERKMGFAPSSDDG